MSRTLQPAEKAAPGASAHAIYERYLVIAAIAFVPRHLVLLRLKFERAP